MYKIFFALLLIAGITACSKKEEPVAEYDGIQGLWVWTEHRSDPGDGSGTWRPVDTTAYLEFGKGTFKDSRNPHYNRYRYKDSIISLISTDNADTLRMSVLELNSTTLRYYLNILGCGGPTGDAFKRTIAID